MLIFMSYVKCILSDPFIVIESFEFEFGAIQKIHLLPWPLSVLSNVVLSARLEIFLFGSSDCRNAKARAAAMLVSQKLL